MAYYARPEEILYHTHLSQNMLMGAKIALLPGDPGRVQSLAEAAGTCCGAREPSGVYKLLAPKWPVSPFLLFQQAWCR